MKKKEPKKYKKKKLKTTATSELIKASRVTPTKALITRDAGGTFATGTKRPSNEGGPKFGQAVFKASARQVVDAHVINAWSNEIVTKGPQWIKASELVTAYAYGKPKQSVELEVKPSSMTDEELLKRSREILERETQEKLDCTEH